MKDPIRVVGLLLASLGVSTGCSSGSDNDRSEPVAVVPTLPVTSVLTVATDSNNDGVADSVRTEEYDNATSKVIRISQDDDVDGADDSDAVYQRDANGNELRYTRDDDADGVADVIVETDYNDQDLRSEKRFDENGDGIVNTVLRWEYHTSGGVSYHTRDQDGDGIDETRTYYTRLANGSLHILEIDNDADDVIDYWRETIFDAQGRVIREDTDLLADGSIDRVTRYEPVDLANGDREITIRYDQNNDGVIDRIDVRVVTDEGDELSRSVDTNADGQIEQLTQHARNAEGQVLSQRITVDGALINAVSYERDALGNLVSQRIDSNGNGQDEAVITYEYASDWAAGRVH